MMIRFLYYYDPVTDSTRFKPFHHIGDMAAKTFKRNSGNVKNNSDVPMVSFSIFEQSTNLKAVKLDKGKKPIRC